MRYEYSTLIFDPCLTYGDTLSNVCHDVRLYNVCDGLDVAGWCIGLNTEKFSTELRQNPILHVFPAITDSGGLSSPSVPVSRFSRF